MLHDIWPCPGCNVWYNHMGICGDIYIYIIISLHRLQTKSTSVYMCICQNPCARVNFETAGTTCVCFQIDIRIFVFIRHMTIYHQTMGINCLMNPFSPDSTSWHSVEHSVAPCSCNQVLAPLMFQRSGSPLQRCLGRDLWFMILGIPNPILNKGIRYRLGSTLTKGLDYSQMTGLEERGIPIPKD